MDLVCNRYVDLLFLDKEILFIKQCPFMPGNI